MKRSSTTVAVSAALSGSIGEPALGRVSWRRPLSFLIACFGLLPGCDPSPTPSGVRQDRRFIAVVGAGQDDPLWPVVSASAERCRPGLGKLELRTAAPEGVSVNAQARLIRQLQDEGLKGLCIQVIDPKATEAILRRLVKDGIVVVTLVREVASSEPYMHCGVSETSVGEAMADLVAEALREKGTLAVLHADAGQPHSRERHQAFNARLQGYAQLTVLREFDCGGDPARSRDLIRQCMARYPRLNAWVSLDNWPLIGLGSQPLLPPGCKLVTSDPNPSVWEALADGRCHAMVGADYGTIVRQALERCATAMEGNIVRSRTYLAPPRRVWAGDLHAYKLDWYAWCSTHTGG